MSYRVNLELNKRVPLDINKNNQSIIINSFQSENDIKHIAFNDADDAEEVMYFISNSANLCFIIV